jgi:cobalt-zinc-cadmium efflux system outer membrane protein
MRAWLAVGLLLCTRFSAAQTAGTRLDEADVIRLAADRAPASAIAAAMNELAEARSRTAGLLPNPSVDWAREMVDTGPIAGQGSQDIVMAVVPIDIARPMSARSRVASESAWLRAQASLSRTDAILQALLAYYDVVVAKRRVAVRSGAVQNLEEAARVLTRREEVGTASGYESTRLAVEGELVRSRLAEARGSLEAAKARLGALLGIRSAEVRVTTDLSLWSPSDAAALPRSTRTPTAVAQARESERLANEASDRASWAWLPAFEIGAGLKRANNAGADSGYGYALGASLSIPLFDHGQSERAEADAGRTLARARAEALKRTLDAEAEGALARFRTVRQELDRFRTKTSDDVDVLLRAAQGGYREGERTIVELLDAQRARTQVAERRLDLFSKAKRAEAELRAATGAFQ